MGISTLIKEGKTEIEIHGMTCEDFIVCEDCQEIVDFWKYDHNIQDTGHENCRWRYATTEELRGFVAACEEYIPYCPKCDSIVDYELAHKKPCSCGQRINADNVIWRNFLDEEK
jgi:hypothetical protein